jgi:hypothetical protein
LRWLSNVEIHPDTKQFAEEVERFAGRTLRYRSEIELLVELARVERLKPVFERIVFRAKFITNAHEILRREGSESAHTEKLSAELGVAMHGIVEDLQTMLQSAAEDVRTDLTFGFLTVSRESLDRLLHLLADLAWVKNYLLDRERSV